MPNTSRYKSNIFFLLFLTLFSTSSLWSLSLARDYFQQAQKLYSQFQYFEAAGLLQKALEENPYYTDAQILLGDSYFAMGNNNSAWDIYLQAEKRDPDNANLLIKLARTKMAMAKNREDVLATEYYLKRAYRLTPRNTDVFAAYGEFYMKIQDYQKALDYYASLGNVLDNSQIFINRAKIYEIWGKYDKALDELKKAEALDGKNYQVLLALGKMYIQLKNYNEALTYLNSAYSFNPKGAEVLQALADLYINQQDFEAASHEISQLILNDPSNPALYYSLALCYESLGSFDKAVEILKEGLKQDYGNEFLRIKAEDLAIEKLPLSSPERKALADFYIRKSENSSRQNQDIEKLFLLKRGLELTPLDVDTRMKIAYIYRDKSYLYEYMNLLQGGAFLDPNNNNFKDQLLLNQKFVFDSLAYKEHVNPKPTTPLEPILQIGDAIIQDTSYPSFNHSAKKLLLESILNYHSFDAYIQGEEAPGSPKAQFNIQFTLIPTPSSITLQAKVILLATGSTFKSYEITEHGNDRMVHAFLRLAGNLERDIPKIGRILKIDGDTALINMGAQQGLKLNQPIKILNGVDLPNKIFSTKIPDPSLEIAQGKITELGENISKIYFHPLDQIVFNMVQQNQSIVLEQSVSQ